MTIQYTEAQLQAQAENERRRAEEREGRRKIWEWIGLPLICHEAECRRSRRCLGCPTSRTYGEQPCFWHYRPEMRFLLYSPGGFLALLDEQPQHGDTEAGQRAVPEGRKRRSHEPPTLLELLFGSSRAALARLTRPRDTPPPGDWVRDPEEFERYFMAGDWRKPEGVCYRPPVRYGERWVD